MADQIKDSFPLDREVQSDSEVLTPVTIMAGDTYVGQSYVSITEDGVAIVGDLKQVISVGPNFGLNLQGPMSIAAMPEQVSFGGGYWRINPTNLATIGSSAAMPVPWLVKAIPRLLQSKDDLGSVVDDLQSKLGV